MNDKLKQRLIGALVLGALAVIFVPMLVLGPEPDGAPAAAEVSIQLPERPEGEFITREIPLGPVAPAVPADPDALASVDASVNIAPRQDALEPQQPLAPGAAAAIVVATEAASPPAAVAIRPAPTAAPPPATATPTPPPPPAAPVDGAFFVAAGSFSQSANAQALAARLVAAGLPAFTEPAIVGGQAGLRVKVGPYPDRAAAEAARLRTAALSGTASVILAEASAPSAAAVAPGAAAAATPAASGYAVQLGAFAGATEAEALAVRARAAGFSAYTQQVSIAQGSLWRVRLGPVVDRSAAQRMQADAAARLGINGRIVAHP